MKSKQIKLAIFSKGKVEYWESEVKVSDKWLEENGIACIVYAAKLIENLYKGRNRKK